MYRAEKKSMQILLSRTQAGLDRTGKQEQEQISPNHVQAFFPTQLKKSLFSELCTY